MEINLNTLLIVISILLIAWLCFNFKKVSLYLKEKVLPKPDYTPYEKKIIKLQTVMENQHIEETILLEKLEILNKGEQMLNVGSWKWDLTKLPDVVSYSDNFARIFEVKLGATITAKELMAIVHIDDRDRVNEEMKKAFDAGTEYTVQYRVVRRNDRNDLVEAYGKCEINENKKTIKIQGTVRVIQKDVD